MGRGQDKKSTMTEAERLLILANIQIARLEDLIAGQDGMEENAIGEMGLVCERNSGYWRLGRTTASGFWVRWKWTDGPHQGHYVIGGGHCLWDALQTTLVELHRVEKGERRPLFDGPMRR